MLADGQAGPQRVAERLVLEHRPGHRARPSSASAWPQPPACLCRHPVGDADAAAIEPPQNAAIEHGRAAPVPVRRHGTRDGGGRLPWRHLMKPNPHLGPHRRWRTPTLARLDVGPRQRSRPRPQRRGPLDTRRRSVILPGSRRAGNGAAGPCGRLAAARAACYMNRSSELRPPSMRRPASLATRWPVLNGHRRIGARPKPRTVGAASKRGHLRRMNVRRFHLHAVA